MPGGDGTGPSGTGGFCTPMLQDGQIPAPLRRGFFSRGMGIGRGRGFRRMALAQAAPVYPTQPVQPTKEQEKQYLENEVKAIEAEENALKQELDAVKERLTELGKK